MATGVVFTYSRAYNRATRRKPSSVAVLNGGASACERYRAASAPHRPRVSADKASWLSCKLSRSGPRCARILRAGHARSSTVEYLRVP
jgi:hypothetical protein